MKLLCYGDSNTYGFDPRSFSGDRYDPGICWCDRLAGTFQVVNLGENGRCIPTTRWEYAPLAAALRQEAPDLLLILLGTNDILMDVTPTGAEARMEGLIRLLREDFPALPILLILPPPIRIPGFQEPGAELDRRLAALSARLQLPCLQPPALPLAFDGVHLSEEGHRLLADSLLHFLKKGIPT